MKLTTRFFVPALLSVAAAGAFASELPPEVAFTSTASRADVMAEASQALRAGTIAVGNVAVTESVVASSQSRDQVRAEAVVANRLGLIATGEVQVQPTPAQLEQVRLAGRQAVQVNDVAQGGADRIVR